MLGVSQLPVCELPRHRLLPVVSPAAQHNTRHGTSCVPLSESRSSSPSSSLRKLTRRRKLQARTWCNLKTAPPPAAEPDAKPLVPSTPLESESRIKDILSVATSLYPVYVCIGSVVALLHPSAFSWFVVRGPGSYSLALGLIMLAMGLTLQLGELVAVIIKRPLMVLFGFAAQYGIMPLLGISISHLLGLSPELAAGLILLSCCPGGTASNVVTLIANGDVPLSVVMTITSSLGAVVCTPLLMQVAANSFVPVDAVGLAVSTLKVVLLPAVIGSVLQSRFPGTVARVTVFSPVVAVLVSSLLASSVFSANVGLWRSSQALGTGSAGALPWLMLLAGVALLHSGGFILGYVVSGLCNFKESQRRAVSIEVGMQNSSLGVVLATQHFASPLTPLPAALSAVLMNVMGSTLAVLWRERDKRRLGDAS